MSATRPKNAPYLISESEVGEPIEIRVFEGEPGVLTAECEFRGDTFGSKADLPVADLERKLIVDRLIESVARLVWNELLGTPVFRADDEQWVERVESRAPWNDWPRVPMEAWVQRPGMPPADEHVEPDERGEEINDRLGDADLSNLKLTQDEMTALMHGEIPESVIDRLLQARSTVNLLESVSLALDRLHHDATDDHTVRRAKQELDEVCRRFARD